MLLFTGGYAFLKIFFALISKIVYQPSVIAIRLIYLARDSSSLLYIILFPLISTRQYLPYKGDSHQIYVVECSSQMSGEGTESSAWLAITPKALFLLNRDEDCCGIKLAIPLKEVAAKMSISGGGGGGDSVLESDSVLVTGKSTVGISFTLRQQEVVGHCRGGGGGEGGDLAEPFNANLNMRQFFDSFDAASMSTQIEENNHEPGENILHVKMSLLEGEMFMLYFEMLASSLE